MILLGLHLVTSDSRLMCKPCSPPGFTCHLWEHLLKKTKKKSGTHKDRNSSNRGQGKRNQHSIFFFHLADWEMWSFLSPSPLTRLFNSRLSSPCQRSTNANHRGIIHIAGHAWLYLCANMEIYLSALRQASFSSSSSRRGWSGGGEGEEEAAGGLQRGLCGEFCRVKYVMKSFAGPPSTWPCLGCLSDRHAYSTYVTSTPVSFLYPTAANARDGKERTRAGERDESETMHSFRH